MNHLNRFVDSLDRISPKWLLGANALLALFVLLAHGGWLLAQAGKLTAAEADLNIVHITIPIAALGFILALVGFALPLMRVWVLRAQAVILVFFAIFLLQFAWHVVADGTPEGGRFVWNPVFFAFLLAYPVYLARRTLYPSAAAHSVLPRYSHIFAFIASFVVSAVVIYHAAP